MLENRFNMARQIGAVLEQYPSAPLSQALSRGQVQSKRWLIQELELLDMNLGTVFLLAGWVGVLPAMMFESKLKFRKILSFDLDPSCASIAETMNKPYVMENWKFKASTLDLHKISYDGFVFQTARADGTLATMQETCDTIINTSCEHLSDFPRWVKSLPSNKLLILQSTNQEKTPEHIGCVSSLEEFKEIVGLKTTIYSGEYVFSDYKRFMLIGFGG